MTSFSRAAPGRCCHGCDCVAYDDCDCVAYDGDRGAAIVDFALVGALLTLLFVAVLQFAIVVHVAQHPGGLCQRRSPVRRPGRPVSRGRARSVPAT